MQQYDEDSALPFAEIDDNGFGNRRRSSLVKEDSQQASNVRHSLDPSQLNSYKKQNIQNSGSHQTLNGQGGDRKKRNSQDSLNNQGSILPRINNNVNISLEKIQKRGSYNYGSNEPSSNNQSNKKSNKINTNLQLGGLNYAHKQANALNNYSFAGLNYASSNMQLNSAKFQKNIFKSITSATPQGGSSLTFTQRVDTLAYPISNYQMSVNINEQVLNKVTQRNFRQTTTHLNGDQIRKSTITNNTESSEGPHIVLSTDPQNNRSYIQSKIKESSHDIHKIITPNAYKVLKMKQLNNHVGVKDSNDQHKFSLTQGIAMKFFSPEKQRFSSQVMDEKNMQDNSYELHRPQEEQIEGINTLQQLQKQKIDINIQETMQEQIDKLKQQIPKLLQIPKTKKPNHSIASLQDLQLQENQLGQANLMTDKFANQSLYGIPQIQIQTIDQEGQSSNVQRYHYNDKQAPTTNQFLNAPSMISQFNHNSETALNESALLNQDKVSLIKEMNQKNSNRTNFYGQFISRCLEQSQMEMLNMPLKNMKKKEIFETDLEKIKVSSQLLDIIDKQIFQENEQLDQTEQSFPQNDTETHQTQINSQRSPRKRAVLSVKQKEKLFSVLAESDKIVVHTSQNKDLMVPSERKDVVRLAQWLEEMLQKIYNIQTQDFYEYFENVQLVCSACMSELIRQISLSVQERGSLVKRVWESILNLMKQAFEQVTTEKIDNEKSLKDEIKQIHKMYLKKLDEYLPEIERYKKKLEQQEQQSKRVVLEFRYLRKKDTKLEKYLKLAKKDMKQLEEDYQKLELEYQKFKLSYEKQDQYYQNTISNLKQIQKQSMQLQTVISFNKKDDKKVDNLYNDHMKVYNEVTNKAKQGFETFNENYENYNQDIKQLNEKYISDLKQFQKNSNLQIEDLEQLEENLYGKKEELEKIMQLDERILEEIEGSDGITLLIGHCGTQTGPDLLKMTHQSVDTSTLVQFKERTTQTFVAEIDVKEIQTPPEWMVNVSNSSPSNTTKGQKGTKPSKFSSMTKMSSQNEVEEDEEELNKKRQEIELQEQQKLEQMKQLVFKTEDEETEDRKKFQDLPFVKQFLIDSPMLQKSGLILNWKDEKKHSKQDSLGGIANYLEYDSDSESEDELEDSVDDTNKNQQDGTMTEDGSPKENRKSKKMHESLSYTIQNKVEKDLEDLHTLVMSRTSYVTSLCERIINHDLLKENEHVTIQMLQQFISDSKQIILEEHNRLKRIWERSKKGILEQVKSKIIIAEKDAEIQEVQNDKEIIEQQIKFFRKEINLLEDKKNDVSSMTDGTQKKKTSQSFNSLEDITDEDEFEESNNNLSSLDDDAISERSQSESVSSFKNDTLTVGKTDKSDGSGQKQDNSKKNKLDVLIPPPSVKKRNSIMKKSINSATEKPSNNNLLPPPPQLMVVSSPNKSNTPTLQISSNSLSQKRTKKKQTVNPLNRVSISLIEAVQGSKTQQKSEDDKSPLVIEKRFTELQKKKESIIGQLISSPGLTSINNSTPTIWLRTISINKRLQTMSSSPNSDTAAIFFNKFALKIMIKEINKADGKTVIMKQANVLRHIQSIYQDKIKSVKNSEEEANGGSRTLNVVTYDYFLNQFGFKKLAETKLKQFLDSCIYYNVTFKIRQFTKLYGINKIMNYDFEDFDFFIKMMVYLEEGSTVQQIQANIYPINRALETLFRNFENKIPASEMLRLKQEMENMKIPDSTTKLKNKFTIDADHALDILLQALVEEKKVCIQNLQSVYLAGDINCDQVIAFDEYLTLFRHFESDLFNMLSVTKFYYQNCDLLDRFTNQRIMTFQKFTLTSVQGDLFSKQVQDAYAAKIEHFDRIKNIEILEKLWEDKKDVIRLRFVKNSCYKLLYRQMIKRIDDHFALKKEERNQLEKNTTWFVYRLLDDESKRVMTDSIIDSLIPKEFNILTNFEADLVKKFSLNI